MSRSAAADRARWLWRFFTSAGSSATVGFHALSDMARALESALMHAQPQARGLPEQARVFTAAAEDIRRLLHQFAAGFLKDPDPQVLAQLEALSANAEVVDWAQIKPTKLIAHILERYHETHRRELPELIRLAEKVERVHASHPDVPAGLAEAQLAASAGARSIAAA